MILPAWLHRFAGEEDGNVTIEFVLLFPLLMYIFFLGIELGVWNAREILLRHAVSLVVRDIRISTADPPSYDEVKKAICARSVFTTGCLDDIRIEMNALPLDQWQGATNAARCVNRREEPDPLQTYTPGQQNALMVVRVCRLFEPIIPGAALGRMLTEDSDGEYGVRVVTAFTTEPQ